MTDERLRALERAWLASGAEDDHVAWLQARLRAGTLGLRRAELAAYCGSRAAQRALEVEATDCEELVPWVVGLRAWGKEAVVRAFTAVGRATLPMWRERFPRRVALARALEAADAWCRCQCDEHSDRARTAASAAAADIEDLELNEDSSALDETIGWIIHDAAAWACGPAESVDDSTTWWERVETITALSGEASSPLRVDRSSVVSLGMEPLESDPWRELAAFFRGTRSPDVVASIASELVPWALG